MNIYVTRNEQNHRSRSAADEVAHCGSPSDILIYSFFLPCIRFERANRNRHDDNVDKIATGSCVAIKLHKLLRRRYLRNNKNADDGRVRGTISYNIALNNTELVIVVASASSCTAASPLTRPIRSRAHGGQKGRVGVDWRRLGVEARPVERRLAAVVVKVALEHQLLELQPLELLVGLVLQVRLSEARGDGHVQLGRARLVVPFLREQPQ